MGTPGRAAEETSETLAPTIMQGPQELRVKKERMWADSSGWMVSFKMKHWGFRR